jgi:hypothetical protein
MVRLSRAFCRRGLLSQRRSAFRAGNCGNKFQTPFARPRGVGESSALVNVIWGWFNFIIGGVLLRLSFPPLPPPPTITLATLLGVLVMAILLSLHFGRVRNSAPHP